ncbi:MAG: pyridoxal-phosphate dependent enzyme [Bacteroidia bacterium]|nr:MAG: pyridoxal-phosphate dependent enzyme [Bacteroidia bacterium]
MSTILVSVRKLIFCLDHKTKFLFCLSLDNRHFSFSFFLAYILAHYDQLAEEIVYQCDGNIDAVIVGVGTGGQMTGIARKIKEKVPNAILVGADPFGSILAMPQKLNEGNYPVNKVEGIGYDFVPKTCERTYVDHWVKTDDFPSFKNARALIQKEGLLVGGSSGSVLQAAFDFIKEKGW